MNIANIIIPEYRYNPLPHPESIRILVLHPAEDRDAPIVCSFLDENPIVPKIEERLCRAANPEVCGGGCSPGPAYEKPSSGFDSGSTSVSAEEPEDELADEMQEPAIESMDLVNDEHDDVSDDAVSTYGDYMDIHEEDGVCGETVDRLCSEGEFDRYEGRHEHKKHDNGCPECHIYNHIEDPVSLPERAWHTKVTRPRGFPEYQGLSYTWGDASNSLPITLGPDGAQIMVTLNCHGALQNLRLQTSDRLLWIDAICINQQDDMEKTGQVRVMGRIYAASWQVLIDIGEETPSSRILFKELKLAEQARDRPSPRPELIRAMDDLYNRPWFHRVWVLQEAQNSTLATMEDAMICCGGDSIRASVLRSCTSDYMLARDSSASFTLPFALYLFCFGQKTERIWTVVDRALHCAATDPQDRVFALRGLMSGNNAEFDDLINYTDGCELTFVKVAQYLLSAGSNLSALSIIRHPHQRAMPSWTPCWTDACANAHVALQRSVEATSRFRHNGSFRFAKDTFEIRSKPCSCAKCTGNHAILYVSGFKVSVVEHKGTSFVSNNPILLEEQVRGFLSQLNGSTIGDHEEDCQDHIVLQELRDRRYDPHEVMKLLLRMSSDPGDAEDSRGGYSQYRSTGLSKWLSGEPDLDVSEYLDDSLSGFSLYRDSKGEIGLVPQEARPGDVICYIKQTYFPILLRPRTAGGWELISGFCSRGTDEMHIIRVDDFISAGDEEVEFEIW